MNRRQFFAGVAAIAATPFIPKFLTPTTVFFHRMVTKTISTHSSQIAVNISANNKILALLESRIAKAEAAMANALAESIYND